MCESSFVIELKLIEYGKQNVVMNRFWEETFRKTDDFIEQISN